MHTDQALPRGLIFGHSHVWSLRRAVGGGFAGRAFIPEVILCGTGEFPGSTYLMSLTGKPLLNPALLSAFNRTKLGPSDWLISMAQGNHYNAAAMVTDGGAFDFILPGHAEIPLHRDLPFLPVAAVRRLLMDYLPEVPQYLRLLAKCHDPKQIIVLGPPPPSRSDEHIVRLIGESNTYGTDPQISPPHVRLKMWHLQNQIMSEYSSRYGVRYLSGAIPAASDSEGFLQPKFVKDAVHANHHYATLMLEKIDAEMALLTQKEHA